MPCNGGQGCCGGKAPAPAAEPLKKPPEAIKPPGQASAILDVTLPAEAQLTVDDHPTASTASLRRFVTPPLQRGKDYTYTLRAEIIQDGQTISTSRNVILRAGERTSVLLEFPRADLVRQ